MNIHDTNPATRNQHRNRLAATMTQPTSNLTIQQQPAGSDRIKEPRSHLGITIKWSLDSASRRRIGLPRSAVVGTAAPVGTGGAAWL